MPVQQQLFPDSAPVSAPQAAESAASTSRASAEATPAIQPASQPTDLAPVWLQRMSLFILVVFCIYLGGIVTVLPWWARVWEHNPFFNAHPQLWAVLRLGWVRGVISGLGLIDVWIGISEAIHYQDQRPRTVSAAREPTHPNHRDPA